MSNVIDERILQMKFDNSQFESGIKESMNSLTKFDKSISSTENTKGFTSILKSIEGVSSGLSAMSIVGITAISRLTNSAIDAGKKIVSALTIDPIKSGFSEYQEQLDSTMVIMSNTGDDLATVTKALDELNVYADKTVYSFSQMTTAIGKFAAAGVNLDDSVAAIKGLSNAAALVGANNQQLFSAYYNLSQSMQMGYLQTIDYNSLANSTIMNKNMRDIMVETAIEMGKFTKDSEMATLATENFKDSLQKKWLTSDVMLAALEKYSNETTDIGKKATAAATEVKSFKQLIDTVLETVGTGWADSFKIIVGDLNEAKKLFTDINDFITPFIDNISKSREELLKSWKDAGGRQAVIDALFVSMKNIANIVSSIKTGIKDLFPGITGTRLADISKNILSITQSMKLSKEELNGLRNIVRLVTVPIKVLTTGLQLIGTIMWNVAKSVANLGRSFLTMMSSTKNFEKAMSSLKNKIKDIFGEERYERLVAAFTKIGTNISNIISKLKTEWEKLKKSLSESEVLKKTFGEFETLDQLIENGILEGIVRFFELIANLTSKIQIGDISNGILTVIELFARGTGILTGAINGLVSGLGLAVSGVTELAEKTDVLNYIFTAIAAKGLYGFVKGIAGIGEGIFGAGKSVKEFSEVIEGIGRLVKATAFKQIADGIKEIAISIAILAGSLLIISAIDSNKLLGSVTAIVTMAAVLGGITAGIMTLTSALTKSKSTIGSFMKALKLKLVLDEASSAMLKLSISALIMAASVKMLSQLSWGEIAKGIVGITAALGTLGLAAGLLAKFAPSLSTGSKALLMLAAAVRILIPAIKELSKMDFLTELLPGIGGMVLVLGSLSAIAIALAKLAPKLSKGAIGLVFMAAAVRILVPAIRDLGQLSLEEIGKGLLTMAGAMAILGVTAGLLGKFSPLAVLGAAAILIMAAAVRILVPALKDLGQMSLEEIGRSLLVMAGSMAILGATAGLLGSFSPLAILGAAAMLIMAAAIRVLVPALQQLGQMKMDEIGRSLLVLLGSMATLGVTAGLLGVFSPLAILGAAAMLLMAAAVRVLTPALKELVELNAGDIFLTLTSLSGGLLLLGAVSGILGIISPLMVLAAAGISSFAVSLYLLQPALKSLSKIDLADIALGLTEIGGGALVAALGSATLIAGAAGVTVFAVALTALAASIALLESVLESAKIINDLFTAGANLMNSFKEGIGSKISDITQKATDCIGGFVHTITGGLASLWNAGVAAGSAFIEGFSSKDSIDSHSDSKTMIQKAKDTIFGYIHEITRDLPIMSDSGEEAGTSWLSGLIGSLDSGETKVEEARDKYLFRDAHEIYVRLRQNGYSQGEAWKNGFSIALKDAGYELTAQGLAIVSNLSEKATQEFYEKNKNNGAFFRQIEESASDSAKSVEDYSNTVSSAMGSVGSSTSSAAKEVEDSFETIKNSVSSGIDVFNEFGEVESVSSSKLLSNMASQIRGTEKWANSFSTLAEKGFSETLIKKLADMGTESQKYIDGLLDMSEEAVQAYNRMFNYTEKIADSSIEKIKVALPKLTETVAKETKKTTKEVGHTKKETTEAVEEVESSLDDLVIDLKKIGTEEIPVTIKGFENLNEAVDDSVVIIEDEEVAVSSLVDEMENTSDVIGEVVEIFDEYDLMLESTVNTETELIDVTKDMLLSYVEATSKMDEAITEWKSNLKDTISGSINLFEKFDFTAEKTAQDMVDAIQTQRNALIYFNDNIGKLLEKGLNVDYVSELASKGVDGAFEMIAALVSADDSQIASINQAYEQVMTLEDSTVDNLTDKFKDAGMWTIEGFATGLTENQEQIKKAFDAISTYGLDNFLAFWGIHSPSTVARDQVGANIDFGTRDGIEKNVGVVKTAGHNMAVKTLNAIKNVLNSDKFVEHGGNICRGLVIGIRNNVEDVKKAAIELANAANESFRTTLDINSPSGVFEDSGMFIDLGLAKGIDKYSDSVTESTESIGDSMIDTMSNAIKRASEIVNEDMDSAPVIRPVLDLSEIQNGSRIANSLLDLNGNYGLNLVTTTSRTFSSAKDSNITYSKSNGNNNDIVNAITQLRSDIVGLSDRVGRMQIVMDSGTLVGEIIAPMDAALGQRMMTNGRGV